MQKIQTVFYHQEMQKSLGWIDTIAEMDELDVLKEARMQLAKIQFEQMPQAKRHIDLVIEIDKSTYVQGRRATHKYLSILRINKSLEAEIQNVAFLYYRQLFVAYKQFFDLYESQNKELIAEDKLILICCRYLNATFAMSKWRYFDDQPAPVGTWDAVHKVIKFAENLAIMNKNTFLYKHQKKETSIATILKQGFMMDTLHKSNYSRSQIQLTEQILRIWATNPAILNKYKQDKVQFLINLDNDKGPERIRAIEKFANYRFWKTTRLIDKIEAYLCAVDTQKPLDDFGLEKIAHCSSVVKLFKKLRADWCVEGYERQRRTEIRNKSSKLLNVSYGLEDICSRLSTIKAIKYAEEADEAALLMNDEDDFNDDHSALFGANNSRNIEHIHYNTIGSENWWMVDESAKGFAVDLGKEVNAWVEPGVLVGYTSSDDKNTFVIAEIKNVRKQANGTYRAGLAVMGDHGVAVKIARVEENANSEALTGYFVDDDEVNFSQLHAFSGLLFESIHGNNVKKLSIIVPRNEYKRGCTYRININGREKKFVIGAPKAKQRNWIRVEANM